MDENNENQRRHPNSLQGLLRFAMDATKSEDAPNSQYNEMDPERRRFLEEALKSLTIDVIEELEKAMDTLINSAAKSESEQVNALEVVQNFVDNMDTANDFYKVGGFVIILPCLNSEYEEVRAGGASLIAELSQNNPFCQEHLLELNIFPRLIELLLEKSQKVAASSMHAISCMVRSYEPGLLTFIDLGGLECVLGCLQTEHEKVHIKVCFLISALSSESTKVRDQFISLNAIEYLSKCVKPVVGYDTRCETILSALHILTESNDGLIRLGQLNNTFEEVLKKIISSNQNRDECTEIVHFSNILLSNLKKFKVDDDTDR